MKVIEEGYLVDRGRLNGESTHRYITNSPHLLFPDKKMAEFYLEHPEAGCKVCFPNQKILKVKVVLEE